MSCSWVKLYVGAWRGLSISGISVVKTCTRIDLEIFRHDGQCGSKPACLTTSAHMAMSE